MAFNDIELQKIKNAVESTFMAQRPPLHLRSELDFSYRIVNQSIELFEVRPHWRDKTQLMETPVAKLTFVKSQKAWKLYWMRQDLKWHGYQPLPMAKEIEILLAEVLRDPLGCFFG